jgi:hypothetical protein
VLAQLAPGRFRLGLGTSGRAGMEQTYGVNFRAPLGHLREYVRIVKTLLHTGSVDFAGRYYQAHSRIAAPVDVPVMAAALGEKAYELCGAEADGAISWVCPGPYLRDVALPACSEAPTAPVARCRPWSRMHRYASMTTPRRYARRSASSSASSRVPPFTRICFALQASKRSHRGPGAMR